MNRAEKNIIAKDGTRYGEGDTLPAGEYLLEVPPAEPFRTVPNRADRRAAAKAQQKQQTALRLQHAERIQHMGQKAIRRGFTVEQWQRSVAALESGEAQSIQEALAAGRTVAS